MPYKVQAGSQVFIIDSVCSDLPSLTLIFLLIKKLMGGKASTSQKVKQHSFLVDNTIEIIYLQML